MNRKTITRNIQKFLFEFIIVTLGILTAFNINKWDENRKLKTEEKEAYQSLQGDLNSDLYVLNYYKQFHILAQNYLNPILEQNFEHVDSLEYYLRVAFDLQEGNATYVNLKYSGKLGILKNDDLKRLIFLYYETYYHGLEGLADSHNKLVFNSIMPYVFKNFKYNPTTNDLQNALKQDELLNLINSQCLIIEENLDAIGKSEDLIKRILDSIDEELNGGKSAPKGEA